MLSQKKAPRSGLVGEPDVARPAVPTPDGGVLVFASAGNLTGQNPQEEFSEVYRYAAGDGSLMCVSCTRSGVAPTGMPDSGKRRVGRMTPRGFLLRSVLMVLGCSSIPRIRWSLKTVTPGAPVSAKFGTPSSTDVYEWEAGRVSLISGGSFV